MSSILSIAEVAGLYGQLLDRRRLDGKLLNGDNHGKEILVKLTQQDSC